MSMCPYVLDQYFTIHRRENSFNRMHAHVVHIHGYQLFTEANTFHAHVTLIYIPHNNLIGQ